MTDLRYRLVIIAALIAASVWSIWPRPVVRRLETTNNVIQYDTLRRIPIRRGLDLEPGFQVEREAPGPGGVADADLVQGQCPDRLRYLADAVLGVEVGEEVPDVQAGDLGGEREPGRDAVG